jgi:hypothetical protein
MQQTSLLQNVDDVVDRESPSGQDRQLAAGNRFVGGPAGQRRGQTPAYLGEDALVPPLHLRGVLGDGPCLPKVGIVIQVGPLEERQRQLDPQQVPLGGEQGSWPRLTSGSPPRSSGVGVCG